MPKPFSLPFGPFTKGLNNRVAPHLVDPDEAVDALNVDLSAGTIRGLVGPGSAIAATVPLSSAWLFYNAGKAAWEASDTPNYGINDVAATKRTEAAGNGLQPAPPDLATITQGGAGVTYRTNITGTTAAAPTYQTGGNSYPMGIAASGAATMGTPGGTARSRGYTVTWVTSDGLESNPAPRKASVGNSFPIFPGNPDPRINRRNIWMTEVGDPNGQLYYAGYADIPNGLGSVDFSIDSSSSPWSINTARPLNWGEGGSPSTPAMATDHSPAPNLTVLSDSLHSVTEGSGAPGSGILFGAVGNIVRWSMLGFPQYWPVLNQLALPEPVEAITTSMAQTIVFTRSAIYLLSGVSDQGLSVVKAKSEIGIRPSARRTVAKTPYGVMFLSRQGVAVFDGVQAQVVTEGYLGDEYLMGLASGMQAAYFDHRYHLFHSTGTLVFDLRAFPAIRLTRSDLVVKAAHVTPYSPDGITPGLYVLTGGQIRPWRLAEGLAVPGSARMPWKWRTGALTAGVPHLSKTFRALKLSANGDVSVKAYKDDEATERATLTKTGWLPASLVGEAMAIELSGTGEVRSFAITGLIADE